ncbi:MAG TPA: DUF4019 domain-containing protein [Casimicrobiaceae bacterium]|nr:DUF4019 domain-containing protein [Casimicrobiaceae bacterium]
MRYFAPVSARIALALVCGALLASNGADAQDPRASLAHNAAQKFLALTDANDAKGAWQIAGKQFQDSVTPERWAEGLNEVRVPLGPLVERAQLSAQFTNNFPGAAGEGEYALLNFRTSFAKRIDSRETVTIQREPDGEWRVIGYFIR